MGNTIVAPAGFVPAAALGYGALGGDFVGVDATHPLPVTLQNPAPATSTPLTGTANASTTVGPFTPQLARDIRLTLSGTWVGTVQVLRSADGGATKLPLTIAGGGWASFTANCNETVENESEAAATYYLSITLASGSVTYRVAQ